MRRATSADARLLFDWVNAPDALSQKERTARPVEWREHCAWLDRRLADTEAMLFIVEEKGSPIGQVRLEPRDGSHVIDVYVIPSARERGIALAAVKAALDRAPIRSAVARVKAGNKASLRLFESAGFTKSGKEGEIMIFRLDRTAAHG